MREMAVGNSKLSTAIEGPWITQHNAAIWLP